MNDIIYVVVTLIFHLLINFKGKMRKIVQHSGQLFVINNLSLLPLFHFASRGCLTFDNRLQLMVSLPFIMLGIIYMLYKNTNSLNMRSLSSNKNYYIYLGALSICFITCCIRIGKTL